MSRSTDELIDELARLKPGSPALHAAEDALEGIEWWNSLYPRERAYWLERANSAAAVDAWRAFKLARIGDAIVAKCAREFGRSLFPELDR